MNFMVESAPRPPAIEACAPGLVLLGRGSHTERLLPDWCDAHLAPPCDRVFDSRLWYETVLAHALPSGAYPLLAIAGPVVLPLLSQEGRLSSLVTPYSLQWRPLVRPGATPAALRAAGGTLATLLLGRPPTRLDALDSEDKALEDILDGMHAQGILVERFRHFGNWRHRLEGGWEAYLAARPPELRTTIGRKLARAAREASLTLHDAPGPGLEAAIAAYVMVRAKSWKPDEPFPDFDAALLRASAKAGLLRMGVLCAADGTPMAAQYWLVSGRRASLLKLAHDEAARAASPGTALTAMMIRELITRDAVTELDFGRGDDAYKQLWASDRHQRMGVMLTDPWHPAGMLEMARQAAARARRLLRPVAP